MPNIRVNHLEVSEVTQLSRELTHRLSKELECPLDWITFSIGTPSGNTIFSEGNVLKDSVTMFVEWFDRGQEVKDAVARILTEGVYQLERKPTEKLETVTVIFIDIDPKDYYENGIHF